MTKLTDQVEYLPEEVVKAKIVEQKKIEPVKYYRLNPNKCSKTAFKRLMSKKTRISNE